MKTCAKCGREKKDAEFYKNKSRKGGLSAYCKVCESGRQKKYNGTKRPAAKTRSTVAGHRICTVCRREKTVSEFYKSSRIKDGLSSRCKVCDSSLNKVWRSKNPKKTSHYYLKSKLKVAYGVSIDNYMELLKSQNGVCAICENTNGKKRLCVDHCHKTGKLRGLLCDPCNTLLGCAKDCTKILGRASMYLERFA